MQFLAHQLQPRPLNYTPLDLKKLRRRHRPRKRMILFFLIFAIGLTAYVATNKEAKTLVDNAQPPIVREKITNLENQTSNFLTDSRLDQIVEKALTGTKGTYGVAVKNLKTGENYYHLGAETFQTASLYKLWIMVVTYDQIKNGVLKEDQILEGEIPALNKKFNIASEEAELTEGSVKHTVTDALDKMITVSDNYSALLLSEKIGLKNVQKFLDDHGFINSHIGQPPQTTTSDITLFFEKLYKGELADEEYTTKMLDLLKKQKLNDTLPKYLPKGTKVAHKTGQLGLFAHDAGIVYMNNGDYVITVLSKSGSPEDAKDRIANISQQVYNYFQTR